MTRNFRVVLALLRLAAVASCLLGLPLPGQQGPLPVPGTVPAVEQERVETAESLEGLREVTDRRTEHAKHFELPGGGFRAMLTPEGLPQHWWNGREWAGFDLRLRPVHKGEPHDYFEYTSQENGLKTWFLTESPIGEWVRVEHDGLSLLWVPMHIGPEGQGVPWGATVATTAEGPELTLPYYGTNGKIKSVYTLLRNGLKHDVVLGESPTSRAFGKANYVLTWAVMIEGATAITGDDGKDLRSGGETSSILIQGRADARGLVVPVPVLRDATGRESPAKETAARYRLRHDGGDLFTLELVVPMEWLGSSDRAWPVTIDPSITLTPTAPGCASSPTVGGVGSVDDTGTAVPTPFVDWDRNSLTCNWPWVRSVSWARFPALTVGPFPNGFPACATVTQFRLNFHFLSPVANQSAWEVVNNWTNTICPPYLRPGTYASNVTAFNDVVNSNNVVASGSTMHTTLRAHTITPIPDVYGQHHFGWRAMPNFFACGSAFLDSNSISADVFYNLPSPIANPSRDDPLVCLNNYTTFRANPQGTNYTYRWSFPGGSPSTSNSANQQVTFSSVGVYCAQLVVSDQCGTSTYQGSMSTNPSLCVTVLGRAEANPQPNPAAGCVNRPITFNANGNTAWNRPDPSGYSWTFTGGPGPNNSPNPTVTWTSVGNYIATLTVSNSCGNNQYQIPVTICALPTANPSPSQVQGCVGVGYPFSANPSSFCSTSYLWIFPEGTPPTSTDANPLVAWSTTGSRTATLTVSNSCGSSPSYQIPVTICAPPTATPTPNPAQACVNLQILFNANTQSSLCTLSYAWTFPGGSPGTSSSANPSVSWPTTGSRTATLTVSNSCGPSPQYRIPVTIGGPATASPSASPNPAWVGQVVQFRANASNAASYSWTFPGGTPTSSPQAEPLVTYNTPGSKEATLTVTGLCGGPLPYTVSIQVDNPTSTITSISPPSRLAGLPEFTLTVTGTNFVSSSVVTWNDSELPTTFWRGTQLTAAVRAELIATFDPVPVRVAVVNPPPGGGTSNVRTFTIKDPNGDPAERLRISSTGAGPSFTLAWVSPQDIGAANGLLIRHYSAPDRASPPTISTNVPNQVVTAQISIPTPGSTSYVDVVVLRGANVQSQPTKFVKVTYTTNRLHGDVTGDGLVDGRDLIDVLAAYQTTTDQEGWNPAADCNGDGQVTAIDIQIVQMNMARHL